MVFSTNDLSLLNKGLKYDLNCEQQITLLEFQPWKRKQQSVNQLPTFEQDTKWRITYNDFTNITTYSSYV
jgi:hypothetical protein